MFNRSILVFDTETTGVTPGLSSIIQLGVIKLDEKLEYLGEFNKFVKPYTGEWTKSAEGVHGINQSYLDEHGLPIEQVLKEFNEWLNNKPQDYYLAQWSSSFDSSMLIEAYKRVWPLEKFPFSRRVYDIASIARFYLIARGDLHSSDNQVGLVHCAEKLGIPFNKDMTHDALYDAKLTARVARTLYYRIRDLEIKHQDDEI